MPGDSELLEIVDTLGILTLTFHTSESGQKHCGENGDDGDHDQQFDEGEAELLFHTFIFLYVNKYFCFQTCYNVIIIH